MNRKPSDVKVIGAAGRLVNQKGFDLLLLVAAQLKERGHRFRIEIAGEGLDRPALEQQIEALELSAHVVLKGFVNDMPSFFNSCDVFVLPSRYEGFGYVMVEAMLAQKPVIAFKTSSATDIVIDNETGFLVDAFDLSQFADKIATLITNGMLATTMGQKGYQRALERFPLKKATEELIACLSE
jgi:glycosyltransferase involved in cell wall biosynthesis